MIREALGLLVSGRSLTMEEASLVMEDIMTGEATPAQFGAFVTALRLKGETVEETLSNAKVAIASHVAALREEGHAVDGDNGLLIGRVQIAA